MTFTDREREFLRSRELARLATLGPGGGPQLRPVLYRLNEELGTLEIGGWDLGATQKYRNVAANPLVAIVVDDVTSWEPFRDLGVEVRGVAEAIDDHGPLYPDCSDEIIRIHPRRIISWGLDPSRNGRPYARNVVPATPAAG